jgi:hypothetical protein
MKETSYSSSFPQKVSCEEREKNWCVNRKPKHYHKILSEAE